MHILTTALSVHSLRFETLAMTQRFYMKSWQRRASEDFSPFIYRNSDFYLSFKDAPIRAGHSHADQTRITLSAFGEDIGHIHMLINQNVMSLNLPQLIIL